MAIRRKSWVCALLIALVIGAMIAIFSARIARRETVVEGKPLSAWVQDLGKPNLDASSREHAFEVLASQPPAMIPELLRLRAETRITAQIERRLRQFGRKVERSDERVSWDVARDGILRVITQISQTNGLAWEPCAEAPSAVDELLRELKANPAKAGAYAYMISAFGVNATNALPTLIQVLPIVSSATNSPEQILILLTAIADIGPGSYAPQVIPPATNLLSSGGRSKVDAALRVLGACGSNALPFIPQIVEHLNDEYEMTPLAVRALAEIGFVPPELKPRLMNWMERGSGPAAVAMLEVDPDQPTALNIVRARLHPLAGRDHVEMIQLISRVPRVAKLFILELQKLAGKTNGPTSHLARQTLRELPSEPK